MPDVSVIIPAWQSAATIGRALASVAAQTRAPAQVIVCDDGSDDGTAEVAAGWRGRLGGAELTVLCQTNQGAGAARNRCLAAARGDVVAFLDADDEWLPTKLHRSLAELSFDLAFVSHDMVIDDTHIDCVRHFDNARNPFVALFLRGFVATSTVVARKAAILDAGGFDPTITAGQDYDLWLAIAAASPFKVFGEALTRYHITAGSITSRTETRRQGSLRILRRHAAALTARGVNWRLLAGLRSLIIHYEAFHSYRRRGQSLQAGFTLARAFPETARVVLAPASIDPRPTFPAILP